jgi:4-deoxy-L-threo-5-hexosulose-uronate ketol-isomerase
MITEFRYSSHPEDVKHYDTEKIRKDFLIEEVFIPDEIKLVYSMFDRIMAGGAMPVKKPLTLEAVEMVKSEHFLDRREMGIINVGGEAIVEADGTLYNIAHKEALYLGKGTRNVVFKSVNQGDPAKLYINTCPAHHTHPSKRITLKDAEVVVMGSPEESNHRTINKLIHTSVLPTCQLQMGMTELKPGSVWNTMPVHTHIRRMEVYFYFEVPEKQAVCHFMGDPDETRHLWMKNEQAVISPSWSIHSAAGTSNYTFIWGMCGENMDYGDVITRYPDTLK